jgi:E-phenylitaconyl-CoA hydratase
MPLQFEKKDKIAYITINRPEAMNSLDLDMLKQLNQVLSEYRDDDNLRAAIITGTGKAFCAGGDLKTIVPLINESRGKFYRVPVSMFRGVEMTKPLIAAVNGLAMGGGLELALACDLRVASEKATFCTPEVGIGGLPGWGGVTRLSRVIPQCKASEMLLLGLPLDAQEAYRIGLINKVVPPEQLMPAAEQWAKRLCDVAPLAAKAIKDLTMRAASLPIEEGLKLEEMYLTQLIGSEDNQEGLKAIAEKRKPEFKGK